MHSEDDDTPQGTSHTSPTPCLTRAGDLGFEVFYIIHPSSEDAVGGSDLPSRRRLHENHSEAVTANEGLVNESHLEIGSG